MGIKTRRKILVQKDKSGRIKSKALSLPLDLHTQDESPLAADSLILADPTCVLDEDELHSFLELIEPRYWELKRKKERKRKEEG